MPLTEERLSGFGLNINNAADRALLTISDEFAPGSGTWIPGPVSGLSG